MHRILYAFIVVVATAQVSEAHFPWATVSEDGQVQYFFGENIADRTYKMPASIAKVEVTAFDAKGKASQVKLEKVESEKFVGLQSTEKYDAGTSLISQVTFGIYQNARLDYYTIHAGSLPKSLDFYKGHECPLALTAKLVQTDKGVDVYVSYKKKPLVGKKVKLFCDEGHEEGAAETDKDGKVSFTKKEVEEGLNGIVVGLTDKEESGVFQDKPYKAASHYLTITFNDPEHAAK